jgi:hypothetical protein
MTYQELLVKLASLSREQLADNIVIWDPVTQTYPDLTLELCEADDGHPNLRRGHIILRLDA